ncbi:oligopeptide ABC transporter substrate-binding protein [Isobaculum melis]|uniref:oligopeptide ABC transporter substrate-binding protein n=1 Tax=Isobaculum melis TaxID=142588 RepID=UPI003CCBE2BB
MGKKAIVALLSTTLILTGCGGGNKDGKKEDTKNVDEAEKNKFSTIVENDEKAIEGGTLQAVIATESAFKGVFSNEFQEDAFDSQLNDIALGALFTTDADFNITNDGAASLELDKEAKKATIKINDNVKWSDGEPLKAEDLIYSYEVIGHKDYTGVRYNADMTNIIGMEEYHNGKADTISGIKTISDKEIEISFEEVSPSLLVAGGGIWNSAMPKHYLKDVAIKDLQSSDKIRKNPVGFGPFVITNVVPGESIEYLPNEYYYKGKPKLDKIILNRAIPTAVVEGLKGGKYDVAILMPTEIYPTYADLENVTVLGREDFAYSYLGFKQGKWDSEKDEVVTDPKAKMADVKLRQAMGYAIDKKAIGQEYYSNLRVEATSLIPQLFKDFQNDDIKGFPYDPEKAEKLLDEAGYKDVDGDGIREDKDGKPLEIKFLSRSNGEEAEALSEYMMQEWEAIGLKVTLSSGRLVEFNSFYDKIKADDPDVDVYFGAWSVGSDPTPTGLYGRDAAFNYTRFASKELDTLLKNIASSKSFDLEYKNNAFKEWQEYMMDEAVVVPMLNYYEVLPVNKRVKGLDWSRGGTNSLSWEKIELTAEEPLK